MASSTTSRGGEAGFQQNDFGDIASPADRPAWSEQGVWHKPRRQGPWLTHGAIAWQPRRPNMHNNRWDSEVLCHHHQCDVRLASGATTLAAVSFAGASGTEQHWAVDKASGNQGN